MLLSHSVKFIFYHVFKVAGTSVRNALGPHCYPSKFERLKQKIFNKELISSNQFEHHISASELKSKIPSTIFDSYFKFGFVRNPWDWQVSIYHFTQQNPEHFQHDIVRKMFFENYIQWRVNESLCTQKEFCMMYKVIN